MFRNIAIALVAASVLGAPAMAQSNNTLSGGGPSSQSKPPTESTEKADKTPEKSAETAESTEKSATKHHKVARHHHRHGTKAAKLGKSRTSMAKYEGRHVGHGRNLGRHAYGASSKLSRKGTSMHSYGRASKHMRMHSPSKSMNSPSVD
jgi:hypothetical protein